MSELMDRAATGSSPHRRAVERMIAAMRERPGEPLTLETMGKIAGLSPHHFNRVFRRHFGATPSDFREGAREM